MSSHTTRIELEKNSTNLTRIRKCAVCGSTNIAALSGKKDFAIGPAHSILKINLSWERCEQCGAEYLDQAARTAIQAARNVAHHLLTPAQLLDIRTRVGLSQSAWSEVLGLGDKSYTRWESGKSLQTKSMDNLIRRTAAERGVHVDGKKQVEPYEEVKKKFIYVQEGAYKIHLALQELTRDGGFPLRMIPKMRMA